MNIHDYHCSIAICRMVLGLKGGNMAGTGKAQSKSDTLEAEKEFREEMEQREEGRQTIERIEQQDLNQGMDTGTNSSIHRGVNWGASYRVTPEVAQALPVKSRIEARAYELYLQRGGSDGQSLADWLAAEKELKRGNH
jgi:hypothetical protein